MEMQLPYYATSTRHENSNDTNFLNFLAVTFSLGRSFSRSLRLGLAFERVVHLHLVQVSVVSSYLGL